MKPYWKRMVPIFIMWNMILLLAMVGGSLMWNEGKFEFGRNIIIILFFIAVLNRNFYLSAKLNEKKLQYGEITPNPKYGYGTVLNRIAFISLGVVCFVCIYILWDLAHYKGEFTFGSETWIVFGLLALIVLILYFLYNTKAVKSMYSDLLPPDSEPIDRNVG